MPSSRWDARAGHGQGRAITFETVEPWPEPVEGAAMLSALATVLRRFVVMPDVIADTLVLFVVHAHVHDASDISPICAITSPLPNCGKTTLLRFVLALTPRPVATSNCTPAALFRTIEAHHPTLIADEGDTFLQLSDELRGVLNSGHTRDMAKILRNVGDDHEPHEFTTWCAKFLALIGRLPRSLESRAIVLPLRRAKRGEILERLGKRTPRAVLGDFPAQLARWAADHFAILRAHKSDPPAGMDYRDDDKWSPLLDIADLAGGAWPERARRALGVLVGTDDPEHEEAAAAALRDVGAILAGEKGGKLGSAEIILRLTADETGRWVEYGKAGKPLSQRQLARLLKPFGITPKTVRLADGRTPKGYDLNDFTDPLSRYTPLPIRHKGHTPLQMRGFAILSIRHKGRVWRIRKMAQTRMNSGVWRMWRIHRGDHRKRKVSGTTSRFPLGSPIPTPTLPGAARHPPRPHTARTELPRPRSYSKATAPPGTLTVVCGGSRRPAIFRPRWPVGRRSRTRCRPRPGSPSWSSGA
jgi:Protein of unknown function (DUF3631)